MNFIQLDLGAFKAGDPVMFNFIDHFYSPITGVAGSCSCQVQEYKLLGENVVDGVTRYTYNFKGQITTSALKEYPTIFKTMTVKLEDNSQAYYKLQYSTYVEATQTDAQEITVSTPPNDGPRVIRQTIHLGRKQQNT